MAESTQEDPDQKTQFNMRIHTDTKARWEEHVGPDGEALTLAGFVRTAVQKHINDIESDQEVPNQGPDYGSDILEIKTGIDELKNDFSRLRKQLQDESEISDIAQLVWDELEVLPDISQFDAPQDADNPTTHRQQMAAIQVVSPDDESDEPNLQTAGAIASRLELEKSEVIEAIDHLEDQWLPVVEVELPQLEHMPREDDAHWVDEMVQQDIETHYFKEE